MRLSIILPTFNVEKFIERCLISCLNQDIPLAEYEIIIVNDGSPDGSRDIAAKYAKEYDNIRIVDRQNGGLSAARNTGLNVAKGEYIWFVDPDDWLDYNCLSRLLERLDYNKLDAIWVSWRRIDESGHRLEQFKDARRSENTEIMNGIEFMQNVLLFCTFAWSFIFKKESLQGTSFKEGITFEDIEFVPRTLINVQRIAYINEAVYNYFWRQDSITNIYNPKKIADLSQAILTNLLLSRKYPEVTYFKEVVGSLVLSTMRMASNKKYINEQKVFLAFLAQEGIRKIVYNGGGYRRLMVYVYNISPSLCMKVSSMIDRK